MNKAVTTSNPVLLVESEIQEEDTADIGKMNKLLLTDGFSIVVGLDLQGLCASAKSVGPGTKVPECE